MNVVEARIAKSAELDVELNEKLPQAYEANFSLKDIKIFSATLPARSPKLEKGKVMCLLQPEGNDDRKRQKTFILNFVETPWLNDFKKYAQLHPSNRYNAGLSQSLEESEAGAHLNAIQDAANQLKLPAEMIEPLVVGVFKQTIIRSYGKVYREAVLVDAKKELAFQRAAAEIDVQESRNRASEGVPFKIDPESGIAILAIMTVVLTFTANIVTQGYYRSGLSKTAVIVSSLAAIFIILIILVGVA